MINIRVCVMKSIFVCIFSVHICLCESMWGCIHVDASVREKKFCDLKKMVQKYLQMAKVCINTVHSSHIPAHTRTTPALPWRCSSWWTPVWPGPACARCEPPAAEERRAGRLAEAEMPNTHQPLHQPPSRRPRPHAMKPDPRFWCPGPQAAAAMRAIKARATCRKHERRWEGEREVLGGWEAARTTPKPTCDSKDH